MAKKCAARCPSWSSTRLSPHAAAYPRMSPRKARETVPFPVPRLPCVLVGPPDGGYSLGSIGPPPFINPAPPAASPSHKGCAVNVLMTTSNQQMSSPPPSRTPETRCRSSPGKQFLVHTMQFTRRGTRQTLRGVSLLVQAFMSAWQVKTRRDPSRRPKNDKRVHDSKGYGHA